MAAARTLAVCCPDWPIVAAGVSLDVPVAVVHANRVVATSPAARAYGVAVGQRRREAQACCPHVEVVVHDPARDARAFEPVVAALDAVAPRFEISRPGHVAVPTRGPSRFFGGDEALAARSARAVDEALAVLGADPTPDDDIDAAPSPPTCRVGVAQGGFAALVAAHHVTGGTPLVVPLDGTAAFLAPLPVTELHRPALTGPLLRLGVRTLGQLAALPGADVLARFGTEGHEAWRLASGLDVRPAVLADPPADLTVSVELDPPADTVAPAAFVARGLADELHQRLWARGSACTRVLIGAETEHGERMERVWRAEVALGAAAVVDRLRWQLEGWLQGSARHRPTAGIARLWLSPADIVPAGGRQLGFWGTDPATADLAERAVARVKGLLGVGSVAMPEWRGSRDPATQVVMVPAESVDLSADRSRSTHDPEPRLWPGRLPPPSPAWLHRSPVSAEVIDASGAPVAVSGRGLLSAKPARVSVGGAPWVDVLAWSGPWPLEERWWDPAGHRRRARVQALTADGQARLLELEAGRWHVTATYD